MATTTTTTSSTHRSPIEQNNLEADDSNSRRLGYESAVKRRHFNGCFHQYRFFVVLLAGLAVGLMMAHRFNMPVAVLQMVNQTHLYLEEHPNSTFDDFLDEGFVPCGEFNWNNEIVAIILGWYMFSYTLPQLAMARWNLLIGCRLAVPISLIICSISTLLIPPASYLSWHWVVVCRLVNGFGAAGLIPAMLTVIENWCRYDELATGLSIGTTLFASVAAFCPLFTGYLAAIHWSLAFYVLGCATLAFSALWLVCVTNRPGDNWLISERELNHLEQICDQPVSKQAQPAEISSKQTSKGQNECKQVSWVRILKLPTFYAYVSVWAFNCSSLNCFIFILPAYMRQFLKIPIAENGFYCFIIQLGYMVASIWPPQLIRLLLRKNLTMTQARRTVQGIAGSVATATFVYVGLYHQHQLPLFFLNRCFIVGDITITGSVMSNFAKVGLSSTAYAMINTVGNLSITGASPLIGKWLDFTGSSRWGWQLIFFAFGFVQLIQFGIFSFLINSEPIEMAKEKQANKVRAVT